MSKQCLDDYGMYTDLCVQQTKVFRIRSKLIMEISLLQYTSLWGVTTSRQECLLFLPVADLDSEIESQSAMWLVYRGWVHLTILFSRWVGGHILRLIATETNLPPQGAQDSSGTRDQPAGAHLHKKHWTHYCNLCYAGEARINFGQSGLPSCFFFSFFNPKAVPMGLPFPTATPPRVCYPSPRPSGDHIADDLSTFEDLSQLKWPYLAGVTHHGWQTMEKKQTGHVNLF